MTIGLFQILGWPQWATGNLYAIHLECTVQLENAAARRTRYVTLLFSRATETLNKGFYDVNPMYCRTPAASASHQSSPASCLLASLDNRVGIKKCKKKMIEYGVVGIR
jgi:hypothetical protein